MSEADYGTAIAFLEIAKQALEGACRSLHPNSDSYSRCRDAANSTAGALRRVTDYKERSERERPGT